MAGLENRDPYHPRFMRDGEDELKMEPVTVKPLFHGGCVGCVERHTSTMVVCSQCCYHEADWNLPNRSRGKVR